MSVGAETPFERLVALVAVSRRAPVEPFRGLEPLRFADAGILAAREAEIERLLRLVTMYRGVLLFGESGSGKSSVLNAGLLPRLVEEGYWPHRVRIQPRRSAEFVFEAIHAADAAGETVLPSAFVDATSDDRLVLDASEFPAAVAEATERERIVLVFDQFEELVTLFGSQPEAQARVVDALVRLLRSEHLRVKLLFAFREDYLASLEPLLAQQPELADQSVRLVPPPAESAREIIRAPFERFADAYDREFPTELAERIATSLAHRSTAGALNLSELQVVCRRLWQADDPARLLADRGVEGILEDFLNERLEAFEDADGDLAILLLTRLVTTSGTRNVVSQVDIVEDATAETGATPEVAEAILVRLEHEAHLIRSERRRDVTTFEIVSEFLVPMIAVRKSERAARASEAEFQRRLDVEAREKERAQAQARKDRIRLWIALGAFGVAVGAIVLGGVFWVRASEARDRERSQRWAAQSAADLTADPFQSVRDALKGLGYSATPDAEGALRQALSQRRLLAKLPTAGWGFDAAIGGLHGEYVALASRNGLHIWNSRLGKEVKLLKKPGQQLITAFDAKGRYLLGAGTGGAAVWDVVACASKPNAACLPEGVWDGVKAAISRDGRWAATGYESSAQVHALGCTEDCDGPRLHLGASVASVAVDDAGAVAAAGEDGAVKIWRPMSTRASHVLKLQPGSVASIALSRDGRFLAAAGGDTLRVWDLSRCKSRSSCHRVLLVRDPGRVLESVSFSVDGDRVVTASDDGVVRVFERTDSTPVLELRGHDDAVLGARFDRTGEYVVSASADRTVRLWDVRTGTVMRGNAVALATATFSWHDPNRLVTVGVDGTARILDAGGKQLASLFVPPRTTALAPEERQRLPSVVTFATFSSDDERVLTADEGGDIRVWSVAQCIRAVVCESDRSRVIGHREALFAVGSGPHGNLGVVATSDSTSDSFELARLGPPRVQKLATLTVDPVYAVNISLDGNHVIAATLSDQSPGPVWIWDVSSCYAAVAECDTGDPIRIDHGSNVYGVALSPDGKRVVTGGIDRIARVWTLSRLEKESPLELRGHTSEINSVAFDSTGERIVTGSSDGAVRVWDAGSGAILAVLENHGTAIKYVEYAPGTSGTILSLDVDGTARLLRCKTCGPFDKLWRRARQLEEAITKGDLAQRD